MRRRIATLVCLIASLGMAAPGRAADTVTVALVEVTDWKAVYGRVEARDQIAARARLGGTLVSLSVAEGDNVQAGQPIGEVVDQKIAFQLGAIDAQLQALASQQGNAEAELARGEELLSRGVTTAQRLDALRTQVDVLTNQIAAQRAQRQVIEQQATEGTVLAPLSGRVLSVPVAEGSVVMAGEVVATVGGGGFYLRLAVPERHATTLQEGAAIGIETREGVVEGRLAKVYPQIENGRVIADVEVEDLNAAFVDARMLVRLPIGLRMALLVPQAAVLTRSGLDFLRVGDGEAAIERAVVLGGAQVIDGAPMIEVLSGLAAGEAVQVTGNE